MERLRNLLGLLFSKWFSWVLNVDDRGFKFGFVQLVKVKLEFYWNWVGFVILEEF